MFYKHFYHATLENAIKIFGKMFYNIQIKKGNDYLTVPISYAKKDKIIQKFNQFQAHDGQDELTISLPRMGFIMGDPVIDKTRQLNRLHKIVSGPDKLKSSFNSIPYTIPFYLSIMTKNIIEMFQIVEQILPFFSPEFTITVNDVPELNLTTDYIYKFDSIVEESNTYDGTFDDRRLIVWTINFTCDLNLYHPVIDSKLIKKIIIDGFQDDEFEKELFSFSTEVIPFESNANDPYILKDIWKDENDDPAITFLSSAYDVFVSNFRNTISKDFNSQEEMDEVWNIIQDLLGIINSNQQIQSLISNRNMNSISTNISTLIENQIVTFIPQKYMESINANMSII